MKNFFKQVLATVVGLIAFGAIVTFMGIISIVGMIASGDSTPEVSNNSVMVLNLSGVIDEQGQEDFLGTLTGNTMSNLGLDNMLSAIKKAKDNDKIKGIYIEAGILQAGYATMQEIRNALLDFKKKGKWIVAYGDTYTQGTYYIASAADKVYLNPKGMIDWHGLGAQPQFYKDLMAKFGVRYQVVKVGTYKSFTETYTEDKMSDANRTQVSAYINGTWNNICKAVSESRKISTDSLNAYADRLITFEPAENILKYKMVDGLIYADQVKDEIKKMLKIGKDKKIKQIGLSEMANIKDKKAKGDEIAVYYAYGSIVQSGAASVLSQEHSIVGPEVCKDLEDLMNDDDVKAVVVRINSGGGDAYASEQLWHQMVELKKKKPVVVSMGDYAASGAYYMSCPANWIVAQPNTLTGSIGIFAAIPDMSGLITQKLGVKFDEVKTNRNSTFGNVMARPFNDEELSYLQAYVNRGYQLFRQRVADGRRQKTADIEKVAQGRVWLGSDALKIKLVDELGGLNQAVAKAASLAKLKEYHTKNYPAVPSWTEQLMASAGRNNYLDEQLRLTLGDLYEPFVMLRSMNEREVLQARIPFVLNIK
ncbi:signal peptide peptidase SppA [Leyella lascolaii]|uniref:Signal peptide peptidase SppA n=3 Tax=Leyella lascolaii TaxID=1776379 RepID=A0AAW7JJI9_9BACT|nr:signal peptide peptidase SppA [Leyella lascolaii]MDN0022917.1 signal peptide peptidase SppA [Leyella lascolaii]MDN0025379.1 signal peptide peptidase SppA [Leyella lascolaii]CCZ13138.1 signal peptide peptidase SppA [Prevotella sp. CAG:487]